MDGEYAGSGLYNRGIQLELVIVTVENALVGETLTRGQWRVALSELPKRSR
jgi:hypothetical protein